MNLHMKIVPPRRADLLNWIAGVMVPFSKYCILIECYGTHDYELFYTAPHILYEEFLSGASQEFSNCVCETAAHDLEDEFQKYIKLLRLNDFASCNDLSFKISEVDKINSRITELFQSRGKRQ